MTLIVVDQFRTTADSYAVEHKGDTQTIHKDFPKVLRMVMPIHYTQVGYESHRTVAYCGNAQTFVHFWREVVDAQTRDGIIDEHDLELIASQIHGDPCQVIIPFSNAVLTLLVGRERPQVEWREGPIHAFGSGYVEPAHVVNEYRSWYSIFFDALDAGKIAGTDIHFLSHQGEEKEAIQDSLKPESTVKRVRRRMPWRQRVSKKAKHS